MIVERLTDLPHGATGLDVASSSAACSGAKKIASQPSAISPVSSRFFGPIAAR